MIRILFNCTIIALAATSVCASEVDVPSPTLANLNDADPFNATQSFLDLLDSPDTLSRELPLLLSVIDSDATNVSLAHLGSDFVQGSSYLAGSRTRREVMLYFIAEATSNEPNDDVWVSNVRTFRRFVETKISNSKEDPNNLSLIESLFDCAFSNRSPCVEARRNEETFAIIATVEKLVNGSRTYTTPALDMLAVAAYLLPEQRAKVIATADSLLNKVIVEKGDDSIWEAGEVQNDVTMLQRNGMPLTRADAARLNAMNDWELLEILSRTSGARLYYILDILIYRLNRTEKKSELIVKLLEHRGVAIQMSQEYIQLAFANDTAIENRQLIDSIIGFCDTNLRVEAISRVRAYAALEKMVDSRVTNSKSLNLPETEFTAVEYEAYGQEEVIKLLIRELDTVDIGTRDFSILLRKLVNLSGLTQKSAKIIAAALRNTVATFASREAPAKRISDDERVRIREDLVDALEKSEQEVLRFSSAKNLEKITPVERIGGKYLAKWANRIQPLAIAANVNPTPDAAVELLPEANLDSDIDKASSSDVSAGSDVPHSTNVEILFVVGLTLAFTCSGFLLFRYVRK